MCALVTGVQTCALPILSCNAATVRYGILYDRSMMSLVAEKRGTLTASVMDMSNSRTFKITSRTPIDILVAPGAPTTMDKAESLNKKLGHIEIGRAHV